MISLGPLVKLLITMHPPPSFDSLDGTAMAMKNGYEWMAKLDISEAYRAVLINSKSCKQASLQWDFEGVDCFMLDPQLPFGSSVIHSILQHISQSTVRMTAKKNSERDCYMKHFFSTKTDWCT